MTPTALSLTLTYEDMTTISVKAADRTKADWAGEVAEFFDKLAREGNDAQPITVVGAKVVKSGTLKKGEDSKVLRDVEFAFVQLELQQGTDAAQPRGLPMIFLKTSAGWRFSPRP